MVRLFRDCIDAAAATKMSKASCLQFKHGAEITLTCKSTTSHTMGMHSQRHKLNTAYAAVDFMSKADLAVEVAVLGK